MWSFSSACTVTKQEMRIKVPKKKERVVDLALSFSVIELLHDACYVPGAQHSERCVWKLN